APADGFQPGDRHLRGDDDRDRLAVGKRQLYRWFERGDLAGQEDAALVSLCRRIAIFAEEQRGGLQNVGRCAVPGTAARLAPERDRTAEVNAVGVNRNLAEERDVRRERDRQRIVRVARAKLQAVLVDGLDFAEHRADRRKVLARRDRLGLKNAVRRERAS